MAVPPGTSRQRPTIAAQQLTSRPGKKRRPKPMPTAAIARSDEIENPGYLGVAEAYAVVEATGLPIVARSSLPTLASSLSEIAHRLFCDLSWPNPSPAGERVDWVRDVKTNANALLANFGRDPGTREVEPRADAVAVLFGYDQPLRGGLKRSDDEAPNLQLLKDCRRETNWLFRKMNFVDPLASLDPWELEWLSLNKRPSSSPRPEVEVIRVTLLGLSYIAWHAETTAENIYPRADVLRSPLSSLYRSVRRSSYLLN
jgi:hypothetical protein